MRHSLLTPFYIALFLLPVSQLLSAPGEDSEMQARSRNYLLHRGTLSMEKLLESPDLSPSQVATIDLLLRELRPQMRLFLDSSGLEGEALQAKLRDLLEVTRYKVSITEAPQAAPPPGTGTKPD